MEKVDRELPNGRTLFQIPKSMTKRQVGIQALKAGVLSPEEVATNKRYWNSPWEEDKDFTDKFMDFLGNNATTAGGVGGAVVGTLVGAPAGPPGMVVGGVVGGMGGSGVGSLLEDAYEGKKLDYADAALEALISGGIDLATFKTGKILKPVMAPIFKKYVTPQWIKTKQALGIPPEEAIQELAGQLAADYGTRMSVKESQKMLEKEGATLTSSQTLDATTLSNLGESLARVGFFSGGIFKKNADKVNEVVKRKLNDIWLSGGDDAFTGTSMELGEKIMSVVKAGRKTLNDNYGTRLDEIKGLVGHQMIDNAPIKNILERYVKTHTRSFGAKGSDKALAYAETRLKAFGKNTKMKASELIEFEKKFGADLNEVIDGQSMFSNAAQTELKGLLNRVKVGVRTEVTKIDKIAGQRYRVLNKEYSKSIGDLLPVLNDKYIRNAGKGQYTAIGKLLTDTNAPQESIEAMFKSIDNSYTHLNANNSKLVGKLDFPTPEAAKKAIRQGFLMDTFPDMRSDAFDATMFGDLANGLKNRDFAAKMKAVMGKDFNNYKRLVNLMGHISKKPEGFVGTLMLRGKEYAAGPAIANTLAVAGAAGVGVLSTAASLGAAGAVVFGPRMLAHAATDPKTTSRLIGLLKHDKSSPEVLLKQVHLILNDLVRETGAGEYMQEEMNEFLDNVK